MLDLQFLQDTEIYNVSFSTIGSNIVQIIGDFPHKEFGFTLSRIGKNDNWNYKTFTTIYREIDGGCQYSNDGSVYVEPDIIASFTSGNGGTIEGELNQVVKNYEDLVIPAVIPNENYKFTSWNPEIPTSGKIEKSINFMAMFDYVPTLEEVKANKVSEMNNEQQITIQSGLNITLSDGSVEHFTLTDHDQTSLMGLQTRVAQGEESIPWHTSDQSEHCKYYSNIDMAIITQKAMEFVTYHVTYFRDLRIYINSMLTKEDVEFVFYGIYIPTEYQSEVLADMYSLMNI